jgi:hypothetical protein
MKKQLRESGLLFLQKKRQILHSIYRINKKHFYEKITTYLF